VLGTKTARGDGYTVTAGMVQAFGLTIAGLSDPRVYGAPGAYGADAKDVTDPLERAAVQDAVGQGSGASEATATAAVTAAGPAEPSLTNPSLSEPTLTNPGLTDGAPADGTSAEHIRTAPDVGPIDLFATHEPVQAAALREVLPGQIRQTVSGHVHAQNTSDAIQHGTAIDLVEGSTGAGGLDNIVRGTERPPIEFSIESVGANCQFTRVVRFSITPGPAGADVLAPATPGSTSPQAYGNDVTASTVYFRPQDLAGGRSCGTELGIGAERPWPR
jgi:hypothetical protein